MTRILPGATFGLGMRDTQLLAGGTMADMFTVQKRPRKGRQGEEIPTELIQAIVDALNALDTDDEIVYQGRSFDKEHSATNYGRKVRDKLAETNPDLRMIVAAREARVDSKGQKVGPFRVAFAKK